MKKRHAIIHLFTGLLIFVLTTGFTVIGHRGEYYSNQFATVEHTFQSYNNALNDGADWLEIDLERSADGVLVINHDPTTGRISGTNDIISQTPWAALAQLPLGASGETLHSLEQLFQHYTADPRAKFLIETRLVNGRLQQEQPLVALVARYHLQQRVYYESFTALSLQTIRQLDPTAKTMLLSNVNRRLTPAWLAQLPYITSLGIYWDVLTGADVNAARDAGKQIYPWFNTAESGDAAPAVMALGTDGVITNWTAKYRHLSGKTLLPRGARFRITHKAPLYAGAGAHATALTNLPVGSTWLAHNQIIDQNTVWYEIGRNQWIKASSGTLLSTTPR